MTILATTINNKSKTEKNKKVKEGKCIFPFTYKYKLHTGCVNTEKGKICATEINPKTQTLVKYGYCVENISKKKTIKKAQASEKLKNNSHKTTLKKKSLKIILCNMVFSSVLYYLYTRFINGQIEQKDIG